MKNDIWLIGTGQMAIDYSQVLNALGVSFKVIGRSEARCKLFENKTGIKAITGGLVNYIETHHIIPKKAIIAVNIEDLGNACLTLINKNVKDILLEKPGVAHHNEIHKIAETAKNNNANVLLAYNRRFYASVLKAQEIIIMDGGVTSFNFEFTEWSHIIEKLSKTDADLHNWFLGNSTHVIDLAFYLGGKPAEMKTFVKGGLDWHPTSSVFSGAGISETGALFSYHANWEAPGRWVLELLTKKHRLIFKPVEKLQIQEIGSVAVNPVDIDDHLDIEYKPGLYLETKDFLSGEYIRFCNVHTQRKMIEEVYIKISGYK